MARTYQMGWVRSLAFLMALLLFQAVALPAPAAAAKAKGAKTMGAALPVPESIQATMTDEQYKEAMAAAKKTRKVASDSDTFNYASAYSDDAKNLHSKVNGGMLWKDGKETNERVPGIRNPAEITKLIEELERSYEQLEPDAKFMAAFWIALKPWKGFVHRARPLVEKHNLSQSAIVTFLRATHAGINIFLPDSPAWQAGFDYLTMPARDLGPKITTDEELYRFSGTVVLPVNDAFNQRISRLSFKDKPIYFDNKLVFRNANFVSARDRHVRLGEAERLAVLAGGLLAYSNLSGSIAYSWDGFFEASDQVAKVYGFASSLNDGSMTAERRFVEIRKKGLLFQLRPGGEAWTRDVAFPKFKEGLRTAKASWAWLKANETNSEATRNIFDPRAFVPFTRIIDTSFDNIESLLEDKGIASAVVNGEVVDVNFKAFFHNPPKDLKAFFPTSFVQGQNTPIDPVTREKYRNYSLGNPSGWDVSKFQPYFPNVRTNDDVKRAARVLNQSWGGWLLGIPFAGVTM